MITKLETTLFFGMTVSALTLAAVIGLQEFRAAQPVQQALTAPLVKLEAVEIIAPRTPVAAMATVNAQAPGG